MDIWVACKDKIKLQTLSGEIIRVVENQEQIATNSLVDNLDEQALLEQMLESSKPKLNSSVTGLHYLLSTPFRYPPLKYGSRFGSRFEPSLFYGSENIQTALSESAYYRFLFWYGMVQPPPGGRLTTEHTVFAANYTTNNALQLQSGCFEHYRSALIDPVDYTATQLLGVKMRAATVEVFQFESARDFLQKGVNIALFSPKAFSNTQPIWQEPWLCDTRGDEVVYLGKEQRVFKFSRESFEFGTNVNV